MAKKNKKYSEAGYKTLDCSKCEMPVERVAEDATAVICWKCAMKNFKKNEESN